MHKDVYLYVTYIHTYACILRCTLSYFHYIHMYMSMYVYICLYAIFNKRYFSTHKYSLKCIKKMFVNKFNFFFENKKQCFKICKKKIKFFKKLLKKTNQFN